MAPKKRVDHAGPSPFTFTYDDFTIWFEQAEKSLFEPARATVVRLLDERLDRELDEFDRNRIRIASSRVKRPTRLWTKMAGDRYRERIKALDDVAAVIDDIVGVRIVCNNLCDMDYLTTVLSDFPNDDDDDAQASLAVERESEKRYVDEPKPSGYRAYHLNLLTAVPRVDGIARVRTELQVRTLLQDGWGELTHEDTYKPGVELPTLVVRMSRRMADLLAAVDDLAQDLREELDRLAQQAVAEVPDTATSKDARSTPKQSDEQPAEQIRQALLDETRRVLARVGRPTPLAAIAQQVRSVLGADAASGWGGYRNFKALVLEADPNVTILGGVPGLLIPPAAVGLDGFDDSLSRSTVEVPEADVPDCVVSLHRFDKKVPAIGGERLTHLLAALEDALRPDTWERAGISQDAVGLREISRLSLLAREMAGERGQAVGSNHLDYVLKALMWSGNLRPGLSIDHAVDILVSWVLSRAVRFGLVPNASKARDDVDRWLRRRAD